MWKLVYFGITYALVFTGYYVTTSFLNIIFPDTAFIGFAIFYAVAGLGCLISPYIVEKLPLKLSLCIAVFLYLLFIGSVSSFNSVFMLVAYGFCGIGSSIIWLIQGIWTSSFVSEKSESGVDDKPTHKEMPIQRYNSHIPTLPVQKDKTKGDGNENYDNNVEEKNNMGIFYAIFSVNMILGNITALIILVTNVQLQIMIWCMLGVSGIGLVLCLFISSEAIEVPKTEKGLLKHMTDVILRIKVDFRMIFIVCSQSLGLNISFQIIPRMIKTTIGPIDVYNSATFLAYGTSYALSSLVTGKLLQKNWKYVVYPYLLIEISSLVGIFMLGLFNNISGYWIIIGLVRGITDNAVNNICNVTFSKNKPVDLAFAFYRLIYSFSYIIGSLLVGYLYYPYVLLIALLLVCIGVIFFHFHMAKITIVPTEVISQEVDLIERQFDNSAVFL